MRKYYFIGIFVFLMMLALTSCNMGGTTGGNNQGGNNDNVENPTPVEEVESWLLQEVNPILIDSDLNPLPTTYNETGVKISWESSNQQRIDNTGKIIKRDTKKITDVDLTYTIENENKETKTGTITVQLYPRTFAYMVTAFTGQFPDRLQESLVGYIDTELLDCFTITWSSSNEEVFTNEGEYIKPLIDTPVVISYRIEATPELFVEGSFEMIVLGASDEEKISIVTSWLQNEQIPDLNISDDINLPTTHPDHGTQIVWSTSDPSVIDLDGNVKQYVFDRYVEVEAKIYSGDKVRSVVFWFKVYAKDISKMSEAEVLEEFLDVIGKEELGRATFEEYPNITQSYNSLFFYDNEWEPILEAFIPEGMGNRPGTIMKSIEFVVCHDTANNTGGAAGHASYLQQGGGGTSWHYSCGDNAIYRHLPDNEVAYHAGDGTKYGYKLYDSGVKATVERPHLSIDSEGYYCFNGVRSQLKKPYDAPASALITPSGLYYEIGPNGNYWLNENYWNTTYDYISNRGGNNNSIGIESMVNAGSDYIHTFRNFADLVAYLCTTHDLDVLRVFQHNNTSGKDCPAAIRTMGYWQNFRDLISMEKFGMSYFKGLTFEWKSNSDILTDKGYIAKSLNGVKEVSYSVVVKRGNNIVISKAYTTKLIDE